MGICKTDDKHYRKWGTRRGGARGCRHPDQPKVRFVEVEESGDPVGGGLAHVAAVGALLTFGPFAANELRPSPLCRGIGSAVPIASPVPSCRVVRYLPELSEHGFSRGGPTAPTSAIEYA